MENGTRRIFPDNIGSETRHKMAVDGLETETEINAGLQHPISVLYFDDDVIIINKPPYAQTAPGFMEKDSAATRIADIFSISRVDQMVVHRLDYATSGIVVFARNPDALRNLHTQFRIPGKIYKEYTAVVSGRMATLEGEIELPLGKSLSRGPPFCEVMPPNGVDCDDSKATKVGGKYSLTYWTTTALSSSHSQLRLIPKTGRTHQLRVHLSAIGHPILGDLFYAPSEVYRMSNRLLLHAQELRLRHPRSGVDLRFFAKAPFSIDTYRS